MIDLCVVHYFTPKELFRLLVGLQTELPAFNLYIADNGSDEDTKAWLKIQDEVTTVFNENIGYAAACNQLAAMGNSPYIGLLNSDVWMTNDDVLAIIQAFEEMPEAAIIGPKQRDERGQITHAGIFGTEVNPKMRGWKMHDSRDELYRDITEAITVSGAAYFIRRSVWEELTQCQLNQDFHRSVLGIESTGAFVQTPHYFEERACSAHARGHGYKVFYDGSISIGHSWHKSHPIGSTLDTETMQISKRIYQDFCDFHGIEREL